MKKMETAQNAINNCQKNYRISRAGFTTCAAFSMPKNQPIARQATKQAAQVVYFLV